MRFRKKDLSNLATAVSYALGGASMAVAQDSGELEEVVVSGIRGSIQQSLIIKRESSSFVDALTAEDIGKFPDLNVAEALQRVPGVTIQRDLSGEGNQINIRGFGSDQVLTLINGNNLATTTGSRAFNFNILPAELISSLEVYKTPSADLEEGGAGGTVVINTRRPLDQLEDRGFTASYQLRDHELPDDNGHRVALTGFWNNSDKTFGILGAVQLDSYQIRADFLETFEWARRDIDVGNDGTIDFANVLAPNNVNLSPRALDIDTLGSNLALQWKPNDNWEFGLNLLYAQREEEGGNQNARFQQNYGDVLAAEVEGDQLVYAEFGESNAGTPATPALWGADLIYDGGPRHSTQETTNVELTTAWEAGDWRVEASLGVSDSSLTPEGIGNGLFYAAGQNTGGTFFDVRNGTLNAGALDPSSVNLNTIPLFFQRAFRSEIHDDETYFQIDVDKDLGDGFADSLEFGFKYRSRENSRQNGEGLLTNNDGAAVPLGPVGADFISAERVENFADGFGFAADQGFLLDRNFADPALIITSVAANGTDPNNYLEVSGANAAFNAATPEVVGEDILAGYIKLNLDSQIGNIPVRGDVGIRAVNTSVDSPSNEAGALSGGSYTDILPSLNLVFELQEDLLLRASYSKVLARPNYSDLLGTVSLNGVAGTGSGGNPDLDPFRADSVDFGLEWYPAATTAITGAIFRKEIQSFIESSTEREDFGGISPNCCLVTRPVNGGSGQVLGAEFGVQGDFTFLPGGLSNFGGIFNYTYADTESENGETLPGSSKNSYNVAVYYEDNLISSRLAYTWRSDFNGRIISGVRNRQADRGQLDGSISLNWDNFTVSLDAINITDELLDDTYRGGISSQPVFRSHSGRVVLLGVRYNY